MKDLGVHALLFFFAGSVIVIIGTLFSETDDARAKAILPRRLLRFFLGSLLVLGVMLVCEHTLASVH
ncbi:MAG: hypothetical protein CMJ98_12635 [Planctomycetes bacterium]|jgi:energy-converting hydrogenase Eha subunit E|nr:hypothetical protein [Candidatus Woesearchaeota archaeon]MBJ77844.1 hypothetical protein [Planctomycetota bacterium]MBV21090.1 hypothetical protein [Planctomycetaceae bacterium]MDP6384892.1 hypothetical protein [Planctomycetota bacterium]MDP6938075.1 hypothetical protein [Planctomycetota bacterium]